MRVEDIRALLSNYPYDLQLFEEIMRRPELNEDPYLAEIYKYARENNIPTECVSKVAALFRRIKR